MILNHTQAAEIQDLLYHPGAAEITYLETGVKVFAEWNASTVTLQIGTDGNRELYDCHADFAAAYGLTV